jgi:hypothetical protein
MKKLIAFLVLTLLCSQCFPNGSSKDSCLSVRVKKIRLYEENFNNNSGCYFSYYHITIEIKNISDRSISYYQYECSWQDYFVIDNVNFHLKYPYECSPNRTITIDLKPGESKIYKEIFWGKFESNKTNNMKFKLGFCFVERNYDWNSPCDNNYNKFLKMKNDLEGVIWSKEYQVKTKRHKNKCEELPL